MATVEWSPPTIATGCLLLPWWVLGQIGQWGALASQAWKDDGAPMNDLVIASALPCAFPSFGHQPRPRSVVAQSRVESSEGDAQWWPPSRVFPAPGRQPRPRPVMVLPWAGPLTVGARCPQLKRVRVQLVASLGG